MVMGVSGSGKTVVGRALAERLGARFLDGDDYHPQANVEHMAAGHPLTDAMRWPWLDRLADAVEAARAEGDVVFACSALKRSYRERLRNGITDLTTVYLEVPRAVIIERVQSRRDHFMPVELVDSQFATLEPPAQSIRIEAVRPVRELARLAEAALEG